MTREVTIAMPLDERPDLGDACICCGRACSGRRWRAKASRQLSCKVTDRAKVVEVPFCSGCRVRKHLRQAAILASAALSAFIGYRICVGLGWWPTASVHRKFALLAMAVPGIAVAFLAWGDPEAPVEIRQFGDRLELEFDGHRCSPEFVDANRSIFEPAGEPAGEPADHDDRPDDG